MSKTKRKKKSVTEQVMERIRIPVAPPTVKYVDEKEKRVKRFNYKDELVHH